MTLGLIALLFFNAGVLPFLASLESIPEEQVLVLVKDAVMDNLSTIINYALLFFILSFIITVATKSVKLGMMRDIILKKKASLKQASQYLKKYFWRLAGLKLVLLLIFAVIFTILCSITLWLVSIKASGILIGIICLIAVIVFIWLLLKLFFSQAALVMENKSVFDSLKSSNKFFMMKKMAVVKVLLIILLTFLVINVIMSFVGLIPVIGDIISIIVYIALGLWTSLFMLEVYTGRKKVK